MLFALSRCSLKLLYVPFGHAAASSPDLDPASQAVQIEMSPSAYTPTLIFLLLSKSIHHRICQQESSFHAHTAPLRLAQQ